MRLIYIFVFVSISTISSSQILDSLNILESYVIEYHNDILNSELSSNKQSKKYNYLYFMPGLGYDFINSRPMVTYNFSQIASFLKSKHVSNQLDSSLVQKHNISLRTALLKLKSKYNYCNFLFVRLIEDIEIYKLNYKLFEVTKKEYENTEITITVFMSAEIEIRRKKQTLDAFLDRIIIELIDLEMIANHSINYVLPVY